MGLRLDDRAGSDPLYVRTLTPQFDLDGEPWGWRMRFSGERRYDFLSRDSVDPFGYESSRASDRARLDLRRKWSELEGLRLQGDYARSRDLLDLEGRASGIDSSVSRWSGLASVDLWRAEGAYRVRAWSYADPELHDAVGLAWHARVLPMRLPTTVGFLGWRQRHLRVGEWEAVRTRMIGGGVRREFTPRFSGEVEVGYAETNFGDGVEESGPGARFQLRAFEGGPQLLTAELGLAPGLPAAWGVTLERGQRHGRRLYLRGGFEPDVEGGSYRYPTMVRRAGVGGELPLGENTGLGLDADFAQSRPLHFAGERSEKLRFTGWIERYLLPWLSGRAALSYLEQQDGARPERHETQRTRVDFALTAALFRPDYDAPAPIAVAASSPSATTTTRARRVAAVRPDTVHTVRPGDEIHAAVYAGGERQQSFDAVVAPDGSIEWPLLGPFRVRGLTATQIADTARKELSRDYFVKPQVIVNVKPRTEVEGEQHKIFVLGEVKRPGVFPLEEGMTALHACLVAGGFTDYASLGGATITRVDENGKTQRIRIHLDRVRKGKEEDLPLHPGDRLDVPRRRF